MRRALLLRSLWAITAGVTALTVLAGCGQKGALYLPDKNAAVVTSAPATAPQSVPPQTAPPQGAPPPSAPQSAAPANKDKSEGDSAAPQ